MTREVRHSETEETIKPGKPIDDDEPDPFGMMPAKEKAKLKPKVTPVDPDDEPDPFAAPLD